jgi:branched-chain amino acid transport system ATP-binding protein
MSLIVEDIHAYYGLSHILHGVNLNVKPREMVGLIGRNGVGKSTTLRTIMGFIPPARGKVTFNGEQISGKKPHDIAQKGIAYVPESREVFSLLTVEENLTLAQNPNTPWPMEKILSWFPPLKKMLHRKGSTLSGGEQQMLVIGRALMTGPQLLLIDEPSQGLAPIIANVVVDMLKDLKKERLSVLLVEQRIKTALELSERVYIMSDGRIVHESLPEILSSDSTILDRYIGISV